MAIDNNSLCYLFDSIFQVENVAGRPVVGGHIEVFVAGTDQKYITWQNFDGTKNPFKIPLNNDGRAVVLVEPHYTYDIYIYDSFNNMICSRLNVKPAIGGDVTVYGLTEVWHDGTMSGEGTPQSPLSVVSAGKVYDGIEPIVVNNIENKISANHVPLGVQDPLYFVQDDEEGCILGCSAQTEIPSALSSKWDEASDAVIANSAQWAEGTEYEAGSYIDITNNTISVVNLPTSADVQNIVDVATSGLMPSGDYLTKESADTLYAPTGNYLTGLPDDLVYSADITGLATTAQLDEKLDKTAFSIVSGDFLTAIPSEYVTENTLQSGLSSKLDSTAFSTVSGDFLTAHQSLDGLMSADLLEISDNKITGYNGTAFAGQGGTANPQIPVTSTSGISIFESGDKVYFNISADYAFNSDLQSVSAEITGLIPAPFDPSYLSGQIDTKLDSAIYANDSGTFLTALPQDLVYTADIADMATTGQVAEKLDTTAFSTVSGTFLTAHQDLSDYQTTAGMTAYQPVGSYLTADALDSVSGDWNQVTAKLDTTAFSDVSGTFLTAHQDISNKLDTTAFSDVSGNFLTAVPDTYLQNTDLSTTDGKVTAISGIPLSAGGDVPEGIMVESGLEYNAVNEISGYNGSAIAQYGHEAQWLVHDDTLVHVANSAQYALGVNLSAVAQLLGVDETVLWEGNIPMTPGSTAKCSESIYNFKRVKFLYNASADNEYQQNSNYTVETDQTSATNRISWQDGFTIGNNWYNRYFNRFTVANGTDLTLTNANCYWGYTAEAGNSLTGHAGNFYKIIGIGRKQ